MKIKMRGTTLDGDNFEQVHPFEYMFELYAILRDAHKVASYFDIWLSTDVNAAEAESAMALAVGADWKDGVCKSDGRSLTRLTGAGGRA